MALTGLIRRATAVGYKLDSTPIPTVETKLQKTEPKDTIGRRVVPPKRISKNTFDD
jgi:hypothetical protein